MGRGAVATHNGVHIDTTSTPLPVFPASLLLNKVEVSRADLTCSLPLRRLGGEREPVFQEQGDSMIRRVNTPYVALVFFFILCQVIGTMCALPDLSVAGDAALLVDESMACPMEGIAMCSPSLTSSPKPQIKNSMVSDVDHALVLPSFSTAPTRPSVPTLWSWSRPCSIVPISIGSSSILRI
jgi:hypothetical protein